MIPGIDSRPDVCGGEPCIVRTRIPVWLLEQARRLGASEQALLVAYPNLRAEDLVNAWAYARSHAGEIESQIRENEGSPPIRPFSLGTHRTVVAPPDSLQRGENTTRLRRRPRAHAAMSNTALAESGGNSPWAIRSRTISRAADWAR